MKVNAPAQVFVVEASAGSGKTYALAKRYLQLLIDPQQKLEEILLRNVLAITFTNKAALEMKERILELLKKIALDKFSSIQEEKDILSSLGVSKAFAKEKAYLIMDYLIHNYNYFQVQTIDSFINSLLSGCAFKFGLSASFKIKSDYRDYLTYSLDALTDKANSDKDIRRLFLKLLDQYLYIENRTGWLPKRDILNITGSLLYSDNIYGAKFKKAKITSENLLVFKKTILKAMHELKNNLPGGSDKRFANQINSFLEKNKYTFNIADVSSYFQRKSFPINKGYSVPDKVSRLWDKIHKELQRLCEMEAPALFNCYIDIFNPVFSNFKALSKKDDVLFLEELNRQAKGLFDEEYITVPELYYRLATRFRHYLIDEFQDTSTLQWRNIFPMVQEAISTGGSLFYVGDKKQAIYRFRGGDVSLFDKIKQEFKAYNLKEEHLLKNYRSHKEIIEFNNTLFSKDNLSRFIQEKNNYEATRKNHFKIFSDLDIKEVLAVFRDSEQSYRQEHIGGYVKVEFMDALSREETHLLLEDKLISLIKDLKKRFTYKDIAILTRKNEEVKLITEWLIKNDIAVESEKTLNIRAHPLVKELVSFLKFLHSPIDNLAFASFILGDIFSRAAGLDQQKMQDFVFQFRCANLEENSYLYRQFRTKFTQTWDNFIEEFFKNVGFIPLYELVISIMDRFCILKNFFEYQGFFMKFLELIKTQEEENASPFAFLEYFSQAKDEDLYVNVADTDSVKVLTIHKAKGLEFGVVILPLLEMELEVGPSILQSKDNLLELLHWQNTYVDFSSQLKAVYQQEYKKAFIDELNNIYVALTRAKQELYIFIPPRGSRGFNYVNLLIPKDNSEKGKQIDYPKTQLKNKIYLIEPSPSEYKDWIVRLKEEFIPVSQIKNRAEILKGEILHYILSFIGNLFGRNVNEVIQKALEKAHFAFSLIKDWQYYQEMMQKICAKEQFKPFFFIEQGMVYQEKEIVDKFGLTKRIDRLIVKPEEVIIIDYKSAKEFSEEYAAQIKEYIKIIKDIYTAQKVRGILLYLDDFTMEEIDG